MATSCLQQAGFVVKFETWERFSKRLTKSSPASVVEALKKEGFDCVFGGIDLSVRCVGFSAVACFQD